MGLGGDWTRVGSLIARRIHELKLTKAEVIRRSGVSDKTLDRYLAGAPIQRRDKQRDLTAALGWTPDSVDLILGGGDPVVVELDGGGPSFDDRLTRVEDKIASLSSQMAAIRQILERLDTPGDATQGRGAEQ